MGLLSLASVLGRGRAGSPTMPGAAPLALPTTGTGSSSTLGQLPTSPINPASILTGVPIDQATWDAGMAEATAARGTELVYLRGPDGSTEWLGRQPTGTRIPQDIINALPAGWGIGVFRGEISGPVPAGAPHAGPYFSPATPGMATSRSRTTYQTQPGELAELANAPMPIVLSADDGRSRVTTTTYGVASDSPFALPTTVLVRDTSGQLTEWTPPPGDGRQRDEPAPVGALPPPTPGTGGSDTAPPPGGAGTGSGAPPADPLAPGGSGGGGISINLPGQGDGSSSSDGSSNGAGSSSNTAALITAAAAIIAAYMMTRGGKK